MNSGPAERDFGAEAIARARQLRERVVADHQDLARRGGAGSAEGLARLAGIIAAVDELIRTLDPASPPAARDSHLEDRS